MYTIIRLSSIIFFMIFVISSCNKDPYQDGTPELPPITMEGKNTFGFLLDGKVWVPYQDHIGIYSDPTKEIRLNVNSFNLNARLKREKNKVSQWIHFDFFAEDVGIYQIGKDSFDRWIFNDFEINTFNCDRFNCKPENSEIHVLFLDRSKRIISGTFYFKDITNDCGDTIQITGGRFDLKF